MKLKAYIQKSHVGAQLLGSFIYAIHGWVLQESMNSPHHRGPDTEISYSKSCLRFIHSACGISGTSHKAQSHVGDISTSLCTLKAFPAILSAILN